MVWGQDCDLKNVISLIYKLIIPIFKMSMHKNYWDFMSTSNYLGLTTSITYVVIWSKISLLKQLAEYIPTDAQKRFYQGFILPLIDYGSITWGSISKANVERLTKLQKSAARIILKTDIITPSFHMFRELKWSSIDDRVKYNKAIFTYKALNDLTPSYISSLLKPMSEIHALNLRSSDNGTLHIPFARTKLYKDSF